MLDDSLPPDNMSARSATEIVERMKELAQNLGSAFGRLIAETMVPLVKKTLEIMEKRIAHDIVYVKQWSLGMDLQIMFKTTGIMIVGLFNGIIS